VLSGWLFFMGLAGFAGAGPLLEPVPSDRFSPARFELEYLRPWGSLDVQQGRLTLGLPLGTPLWIGLSVGAFATPTVEEVEAGLWVRGADWLRAEFSRRELRVGALEPTVAFDAEFDLRLIAGPWSVAWSGEVDGLGLPQIRPVLRRFFWAGYAGSAGEVALGRRTQPWTGAVRWETAIALGLGAGLRFGLRWSETDSSFTLEWGAAAISLVTSSVWTGPRAGSFGFRVAERR
jgi:hypothetical protein